MDSGKLSDWVQIFGTVAVVLSLIFVGLQLKQTQNIAIANQYQERAALNINLRYSQMQNDTVLAIIGNRLSEALLESNGFDGAKAQLENMTPEMVGYRDAGIKLTLLMNDNNHFQYQSGLLAEDTWQAYRSELKEYMNSDWYLYIWSNTKHQYRTDFRNVIEQIIVENESNHE